MLALHDKGDCTRLCLLLSSLQAQPVHRQHLAECCMQVQEQTARTEPLHGAYLLLSSMQAPPTRKRQLGMSMERSLPKYQFWVMFSVLTTMALLLG